MFDHCRLPKEVLRNAGNPCVRLWEIPSGGWESECELLSGSIFQKLWWQLLLTALLTHCFCCFCGYAFPRLSPCKTHARIGEQLSWSPLNLSEVTMVSPDKSKLIWSEHNFFSFQCKYGLILFFSGEGSGTYRCTEIYSVICPLEQSFYSWFSS